MRPGWDDYFLAIAQVVSTRADCTRRKVGAVLVDPRHRIASTGYNGAPPGAPGCLTAGACPRGQLSREDCPSYADGNHDFSNCIALHAEANALLLGPEDLSGFTMYVTAKPCNNCQTAMSDAGITCVVWPDWEE